MFGASGAAILPKPVELGALGPCHGVTLTLASAPPWTAGGGVLVMTNGQVARRPDPRATVAEKEFGT